MIVDAHQHFWDPARAEYPWMTEDVASLRRRFGPEDLEPLLREHGVTGTVVVQARQSLDETRDLLAVAASTPFVLGVVGWVDLTGDVAAQLAEFEDAPLVGIRHQVHDEADPEWLLRDDVQRGLSAVGEAGLVYDLLVRARELPSAVETARRHSGMRFVLDHVAKRPADASAQRTWERGVAELSECANVACKISGLFTEAEPAATAALALRLFGPERCMWGSDWPVTLLAAGYGDGLALVGDDPRVLGETAIATYRLQRAVSRIDLGPERVGDRQVQQPRVFLDLGDRPRADDDRLDRGMAQRELQRRRRDGNVVWRAHRLERAPPHDDLVRRVLVVEGRTSGKDAAVEHACSENRHTTRRAQRQQRVGGRPVEQRVTACEQHDVDLAARDELCRRRRDVRADADPMRQLAHDVDGASRVVHVLLGIVQEHDVDALEPQALEAAGERALDAVGRVVEHRLERRRRRGYCELGRPGTRMRPTLVEIVYSSRGRAASAAPRCSSARPDP